jgi:hypothetical protein
LIIFTLDISNGSRESLSANGGTTNRRYLLAVVSRIYFKVILNMLRTIFNYVFEIGSKIIILSDSRKYCFINCRTICILQKHCRTVCFSHRSWRKVLHQIIQLFRNCDFISILCLLAFRCDKVAPAICFFRIKFLRSLPNNLYKDIFMALASGKVIPSIHPATEIHHS